MIDILFKGVGWTDVALTLNRVAVGLFFTFSGYHKLFNPQCHRALADELKELGVHAVGFNQWRVPTVEFTASGAVVIGFLAPLAALGPLVITLVAIPTTGPQRINLSKPISSRSRNRSTARRSATSATLTTTLSKSGRATRILLTAERLGTASGRHRRIRTGVGGMAAAHAEEIPMVSTSATTSYRRVTQRIAGKLMWQPFGARHVLREASFA